MVGIGHVITHTKVVVPVFLFVCVESQIHQGKWG